MNRYALGLSAAIAVASIALVGTHVASQGKPTISPKSNSSKHLKEPECFIESGSPIDHPNIPIMDLAKALGSDSNGKNSYQLFRITWFFNAGGFSSSGVALYNRRTGTIKENILDNYDGEGSRRNFECSKVTDAMIQKMSREVGMKGSRPFSFQQLTRYGAIETGH